MAKITPIFTSDIPLVAFIYRLAVTLTLSTLIAAITYYLVEIPGSRLKIYRR